MIRYKLRVDGFDIPTPEPIEVKHEIDLYQRRVVIEYFAKFFCVSAKGMTLEIVK